MKRKRTRKKHKRSSRCRPKSPKPATRPDAATIVVGPWEPKVTFFKELIPWTSAGPVGGTPGKWRDEQWRAFEGWLDGFQKANQRTQARLFVRNGKVWGVVGPPFGDTELPDKSAVARMVALLLPAYWRWEYLLRKVWVTAEGVATPALDDEGRNWADIATQAIHEWDKTAPWEPEIKFGTDEDGKPFHGVMPPKDGKPEDWRIRADAVFAEWRRMEKARDAEFRRREDSRQEKAKQEDDGKGYMSPKWDSYFADLGITGRARDAYHFADQLARGPGLDDLIFGLYFLVKNPKDFRFGYAKSFFFQTLAKMFHASRWMLETLYSQPNSGNAEHDKEIAMWAGKVLAEHYAEVVRGWTQWTEWVRKTGEARDTSRFLAKLLAGRILQNDGSIKPFGALDPDWFRVRFEELLTRDRATSLRQFADLCLNHAGYEKRTLSERRAAAAHRDYDERKRKAEAENLPWTPLFETPQDTRSLSESELAEGKTYVSMDDKAFSNAWNCGGLKNRDLLKIVDEHAKKYGWLSPEGAGAAFKNPLPIKGVMLKELSWLQKSFEEDGRTKTVIGKKRNGAQYLSDVEPELRDITRAMFPQPTKA